MSESGDYDPGPWRGHNFRDDQKNFDVHAGRSYGAARRAGKELREVRPTKLIADCAAPVMIRCDQTGSMREAPKYFFSKAPYLDLEGKVYFGNDLGISFGAVGDGRHDEDYPVQAMPFDSGPALQTHLKSLIIEGMGGGDMRETYELMALYDLYNVETPQAKLKPIWILIGDEAPYDYAYPDLGWKYANVQIKDKMSAQEIFGHLREKYSAYFIQRPYDRLIETDAELEAIKRETPEQAEHRALQEAKMDGDSRWVHNQWLPLIGGDRIIFLPRMSRILDVILGIFAREANRIDYFRQELEGRQEPGQVATVYRSLESVHGLVPPVRASLGDGKSILHWKEGDDPQSSRSRPLL